MSDYDFPELPSDDELGITEEDRKKYGEDLADDGPELSDKELAALLGDAGPTSPPKSTSSPPSAPKKPPAQPTPDEAKARKKAAKEVKKATKEVRKAEGRKSKEEAKAAKEERQKSKAEAREQQRKAKAEAREQRQQARAARTEERKKAAEAEAALPRWRGPATLALLLVFAFVGSSRTGIPRPVPANAPDMAFSSARAMTTLVDLAREPHPPGSPEHTRVRQVLLDRLLELGVEPEVQTATSVLPAPVVRTPDGPARVPDVVTSATVRNVVARFPGAAPTGTVLVTAHYDSRGIAVGAGDDGSGVVTILEALRALRAGPPLANDVIVLFTDAEELGLLGARAFVDQHPWMADVDLVLSFEMRGGGGPSIMFETNDRNGWVVEALADFDPAPFANSLAYDVYQRMPNDTDFTPFREAGVQGLNFAAVDRASVYHQTFDTPENLSEATLQHHGVHALSALQYFGSADLSTVDAPNRVYFSLPVVGLVTYSQGLVHPISGGLLILFVLLVAVAVRGGARPGAIVSGLAASLVAGAGAVGIGWALLDRVSTQHAEIGSLPGSLFHREGWYMLAIAWGALAAVSATVALARRWLTRDEIAVGVLVLPMVAAVALGVVAPLGAMNVQWPVGAALLAALVASLLGQRAGGTVGWLTSLALALPVVLMITPLVELIWLGLSFRLAPALAGVAAFGLLLCAPALEGLRRPNVWWATLVASGLAAGSLAMGIASARPSADRPLFTTLAYAYEHGSGDALWVTAPDGVGPESSDAAARAWAQTRAGGRFEETRDLTSFGYLRGEVPVRSATVVSAEPPSVEVLSDSIAGSERSVELAIRSRIGAEMLGFELDGGTRLQAINGVQIADGEPARRINHWGEPDGAVQLRLSMPAAEPIGVHVVEHLLRPSEILGEEAFARAEDLAPDVTRLSDRAMFRYSVAAFVDPRFGSLRPAGQPDAGVLLDTLVIESDSLAGAMTDSAGVIPTALDSAAVDTSSFDTMAVDTASIDTTAIDTTSVDTLAVDTMSTAALPPATPRLHPRSPR
jgi:hypothetical protein